MIKLFRNIRQNLVNEGKTSKYLKYAVGEILLVVVGILIALQINNWNENKKNRAAETLYLKEMLKDFEINLQKSNQIAIQFDELIPKLIGLLEQSALEKPSISLDSINKLFTEINSMPTYTSTDRVYNNLIGSGDFKLLTNGELKTELANYNKAVDLIKLIQSTHEMELVNSFQPYIIEFLDFQSVVNFRVKDYQLPPAVEENKILDIIRERQFRNIITLKLTILSDLFNQNINIKQINLKLVNLIKKQIN